MTRRLSSIALASLLASAAAQAQTPTKTYNALTVTATVTVVSTPAVTDNGTVKKTTQSLSSYRIANRDVLQLMVTNGIIPTITGYSLIQKFDKDGTSLGYFAWSPATHSEVAADPSVFGFTQVGAALSNNTTVTQPSTPGGPVVTTGTISGKTFGTLSLSGSNCSLLDTITKTFNKSAKLSNDSTMIFTGVASKGTLTGTFGTTGPAVEGTLESKTTKPYTGP